MGANPPGAANFKMSKKFKVLYIGTTSKELLVEGPEDFGLGIQIDYDDVDHPQVEKDARKLVKILNEHWK